MKCRQRHARLVKCKASVFAANVYPVVALFFFFVFLVPVFAHVDDDGDSADWCGCDAAK